MKRHVPALVTCGIIGSALGAGGLAGAFTGQPSPGVHRALTTPHPAVLASTAVTTTATVPVAQKDGVAEPDGSLWTLAGAAPPIAGLARPVVAWAPRPGGGSWEVASDGGVFSRGAARFYGSTGSVHLAQPIVGMAATPTGHGYWMVASDGGVFGFGDARFYGSTGSVHLAQPIVGMSSDSYGNGYWLTAADGGLFSFGHAGFSGSVSGRDGSGTVSVSPDGNGYDQVQRDGSVWTFQPSQSPQKHQIAIPAAEVAAGRAASVASAAVSVALSEVGKPYVYGATGPNAFDCSGLTSYAYGRAGVTLPRTTGEQLAASVAVPAGAMQPGDLLFFYPGVTHVGIYLGNGMMVDAPHTGAAVRVESVSWFGPLVGVGRPRV
ncbi:MAG TPA: C40 family peptidase [Acidimicrobiales bacterium]|nr:C40 family peptidase [Acidimicrobiales bacterium]